MSQLQLAGGCHPVVRDAGSIQFGLEADRGPIIAVPEPTRAIGALRRLARPQPASAAAAALERAGLPPERARAALDELVGYGVLVEPGGPAIALIGGGPLARAIGTMLAEEPASLVRPLPGQRVERFLKGLERGCVVVLADQHAHSALLAPALLGAVDSWLPAALMGGSGVVGPARVAGEGPCPVCTDLRRVARDEAWLRIAAQLPAGLPGAAGVVLAATAAAAAAQALALAGAPAPPGRARRAPRAGAMLVVDPVAGSRRGRARSHPRCPACWRAASGRSTGG
ncbi:hypothetical protein [Corynebacterium otitidis]